MSILNEQFFACQIYILQLFELSLGYYTLFGHIYRIKPVYCNLCPKLGHRCDFAHHVYAHNSVIFHPISKKSTLNLRVPRLIRRAPKIMVLSESIAPVFLATIFGRGAKGSGNSKPPKMLAHYLEIKFLNKFSVDLDI